MFVPVCPLLAARSNPLLPMPTFFRLLAVLMVSTLAVPVASGQPAGGTRTVRILFLNAPPGAPHTAHLHDGSTCREVELPRMNLSAVYELPGGPLQVRLLATPVADPKQIPVGTPAAAIPESIGDAYLLCFSDPANPVMPVRIDVVDAGKEKFSDGMMLWFNLTPHAIGGMLGKEKVRLKPQERALVKAPIDEQDSYPVIILHMIKGDDQIYPICETRWVHDPRSRQLVFVFAEPGRRLPRVVGVPDYRTPPPAPPSIPGG